MYWRSRKMKNGLPVKAGTMSGRYPAGKPFTVPYQPMLKKSRNCGISSTGAGSSIVASTIAKRTFLPRNSSRAKAYAMSEFDSTAPMMFSVASARLLSAKRRYGSFGWVSAVTNVSRWKYFVGNHSGGNVKTGTWSGFRAAVSIQPSGSRMKRASATSAA